MIYLLEDRRERLEQKLKKKLDPTIIDIEASFHYSREELENHLDNYFPKAELVILHKSYNFEDDRITPCWLEMFFNEHGVPVVMFSGDYSSYITGENGTINSEELYQRLPWFIDQNDHQNIHKLIFGERYNLNYLRIFQESIYDILFEYSATQNIDKQAAQEIKIRALPTLKGEELEKDKAYLKQLLTQEEPITVGDFKDQVQQIIYRYI